MPVPRPSFVAYVDESGDEGFAFDRGSAHWFVLSAAVFEAADELAEVKLVDEVRNAINRTRQPEHQIPGKKPLHFRDLKHDQRKFFATRIGAARAHTISVCVHKPDILSPEAFREESRLYFYATRLLVERVSWFCRDHRRKADTGDGGVELIFSNRGGMDYEALRSYLEKLDRDRVAYGYSAVPGIVQATPDRLLTFSAGRRMGLQIADAVASGHYFALEPNAYGQAEPAYLSAMLSRGYRHQKKIWGYGIKIAPRETEDSRRQGIWLPGIN